jgi:epoxyqueuosine reductase
MSGQARNTETGPAIPFAEVQARCREQGLVALGVLAPPPGPLDPTGLDQMLADGVGDLDWLGRTRELRLDPRRVLPGLRAIVAAALPYQPEAASGELRRARYAAGKDYHRLLRMKLELAHRALAEPRGAAWERRAAADSAPLNERTLARLAGLGWIGRNALLISPDQGSYRLLGFLLTQAPLAPHHAGHGADRCGACTACERRCPTRALAGRRVLTERCISYLTIEHHGVVPRPLAERFEGWWFGCDLCQEACPWNRFAPPAGDPRLTGGDDDRTLLAVGPDDFDRHFAGRAVRRIGYERFRRNLLIALCSLGRREECAALIAEGLPLVMDQARELGLVAG